MGRLLAFVLGGAALVLYGPYLFLGSDTLQRYQKFWIDTIGADGYAKIFMFGPGIFAGLALLLLAIRGRD